MDLGSSVPRTVVIDLPPVSLSALCWGPDDGPLALCLHGYPDTAWTWRHLGPALAARGWRVVAPFTRGYAPSGIPTDGSYHVGALMDDALGLHAALGGDHDAVLIGHDWGAITANGLGAYPSTPFARVVSMAVPPVAAMTFRRDDPLGSARLLLGQLRKSWYIAFNQLPVLSERSLDRLVPYLWRTWSPGYDPTEDLKHVAKALGSPRNRSAALGYYRAAASIGRPPERYRYAARYWTATPRVPTLYLHGENDGALSVGYADRARPVLPTGSDVVRLAGAGHFLHLERPREVERAVLEFLSR